MTQAVLFPWLKTRACGVLLHATSLPAETGIGNWGRGAFAFVDFLKASRAAHWQLCPLGPTGYGDSPYQCFSAFAMNPYFIDWESLVQAGLLTQEELKPLRELPKGHVDFGALYARFWPLAKTVCARWQSDPKSLSSLGDFDGFCAQERAWLEPYAAFTALKSLHGGAPWWQWPQNVRSPALAKTSGVLETPEARAALRLCQWLQWIVFAQFEKVKAYAAGRGVSLIGDVPIFVARDSADAWSRPEIFQFDAAGNPTAVAGVPPDYFSPLGQLWGNPLYRWDVLAGEHFAWWIARMRAAFRLYDIVRLDHFRGFEAYWSVPADAADARGGHWEKGPGLPFFAALQQAMPQAKIIAEDLGVITPALIALREATGLPGMAVLEFAFDGDAGNFYLPHNLTANCAVYTGTHDNDTARGWYAGADEKTRDYFRRYLRTPGDAPEWDLVHAAYKSPCRLAVAPLQDLLGLETSARLNTPGRPQGNWQWRFTAEQQAHLNAYIAPNLAVLAEESGRLPAPDDAAKKDAPTAV